MALSQWCAPGERVQDARAHRGPLRAYSSIDGPANQRLRDARATEAAATAASARRHERAPPAMSAEFFSSSTVNPARSTSTRSPCPVNAKRSEEHTSELQSPCNLV